MKNQQYRNRFTLYNSTRQGRAFFSTLRAVFFASILISGTIASTVGPVVSAQSVQKPQTIAEYCKKYEDKSVYSDNNALNACKAGVNGSEDCANYSLFSEEIKKVCEDAAQARRDNIVLPGEIKVTPKPTVTPSPTTTPSDYQDAKTQQELDKTNSLKDFLDVLHNAGPDKETDADEKPDNVKYKYNNGAGKKQDIKELNAGTGNSPAILFFNGGGWLSNDQTGQHVAAGKDGALSPKEHGYAMYDVTYRLGTSTIYTAFEDVMRGIKHMRENAAMYGIDPEKIVIWGDSAGGSLSMRAAASGKSGAKAAVGWSAPTNAYTAIFRSFQSFGIGLAHSTCAPTDLAGFANFANLLNGGSGDVAEYGQGLSSNDFSSLGLSGGTFDPLTLLSQGLIAGKNLLSVTSDMESISSQIESGNTGSLKSSTFNLASKKFGECLDNMNVASPALFASPDTPASFLAGFDNDGVVGPDQLYGMRDKLLQLGIKSEALVLPGTGACLNYPTSIGPAGSGGCHVGYFPDLVCPTLDFINSVVQPERGKTDCATRVADNLGSNNCSAKADMEIRPRGVQTATYANAVVPTPDKNYSKNGNSLGGGAAGGAAGTGTGIGAGAGSGTTAGQNGSGSGSSDKSGGRTPNNLGGSDSVPDANKKNDSSGGTNGSGGAGGGGSGDSGGGGGGGGACPAGATPSSPVVPSPSTSSTSTGSENLPGTSTTSNQTGGLGNTPSNLGGSGGFGNTNQGSNGNSGGSTGSTPKPTTQSQPERPGSVTDFKGSRNSGTAYTEGKRSGRCTVDYSRTPALKDKAEALVDFCNEYIFNDLERLLSQPFSKAPIQLVFIPMIYDDNLTPTDYCNSGAYGLKGFALQREARMYLCERWYTNETRTDYLKANIVHEGTHLTQIYAPGNGVGFSAPKWIVEGIADYIAVKSGYKNSFTIEAGKPTYCTSTTTYLDGYMCGAMFLYFIEREYKQSGLVKRIHTTANKGDYTDSVVTKGTGKTLTQLYNECLQAECIGGKSL